MSEGPVPGPSPAGPGPFDSLVFNEAPLMTSLASGSDTAPDGAQGRVSGNFRIRSRDANHPDQQQAGAFIEQRPDPVNQPAPPASVER
jgi:hypothetical protein